MILYWPSASVTTDRTRSINAELDASTVTPGSTPPDESLTTPAMPPAPCAHAGLDGSASNSNASSATPGLLAMCLLLAQNRPAACRPTLSEHGDGIDAAIFS